MKALALLMLAGAVLLSVGGCRSKPAPGYQGPVVFGTVNYRARIALPSDAVLTLRLLYGLSHKEIAADLGISEHTVKAQLAKGMRRCSEYFASRGLLKTAAKAVEE